MSEQGSGPEPPRPFVLDTSVAVKWYLPEELHDQAIGLLRRAEAADVELLAPGTIQPEFFNALWWHHRREGLPLDRVRAALLRSALFAPPPLLCLASPQSPDPSACLTTLDKPTSYSLVQATRRWPRVI